MTGKADFTEEEWTRLKRAPFVAGMAISLADPGGPIELVKETAATLKTVRSAAESGGGGELIDALAQEAVGDASHHTNPLHDFKVKGALAGQEILEELSDVNRIVSAKGTPEEADAYREWSERPLRRPLTRPRRGASSASTPCASARASSGCSTSSARCSPRRADQRPEEPKPFSPRSSGDGGSSSTMLTSGATNGTSRSWAIRSPAWASNRASPRLTRTIRSSPR